MTPRAHEGSDFVRHVSCSECGSSDGNGLFSDGHTFCFVCEAHKPSHDGITIQPTRRVVAELIQGEVRGLRARHITDETCKHFQYAVGEYKGRSCQIAPYYDADGQLVAQKLRFQDKTFTIVGDIKSALPFGAQCFPKGGKMIVVTEGEIDCMSMSQVQKNSWPVVSLINGASSVKKFFAQHMAYFSGFEKVVLMFDMDEPGRKAAREAAEVLGQRAVIAELPTPYKDANDLLVAEKTKELIDAMWKAQPYRPEGIVELASLKDAVRETTGEGLGYVFSGMNRITYGARTGELVGIGAGAGAGKTNFLTQIITGFLFDHNESVGAFFLESTPVELARIFAGKVVGKTFHVPDSGWTEDDYTAAWAKITAANAKVYLYDSFGVNEWSAIKAKIEYLHHTHGVKFFVLDHLTAFAAADPGNERQVLEEVMGDMGSLVKQIPITIYFVSHLSTPEGKPHEEGGHISLRHFKGARAIGFWTHIAFGLERDQQAEDKTKRFTTTVRCVKNRPFGHLNGEVFYLRYDPDTGLLMEVGAPDEGPAFTDETTEGAASDGRPSDF